MPQNNWILRHREHHGGGLFELEITSYWEVVDQNTGAILWQISSESSAHYDGVGWDPQTVGSLDRVELDPEGRGVLVYYTGGSGPQLVPLDRPTNT